MNSLIRCLAAGVLLTCVPHADDSTAQNRPVAPSTTSGGDAIHYVIEIPDENHRVVIVHATLVPIDQTLYMFPGANQFPDRWARFVSNLQVSDANGRPVSLSGMSDGTWQFGEVSGEPITVRYQVNLDHEAHEWSGGVDGAAYWREWGVFYTGRSMFVANGEERGDIEVEFQLPDGWQVTTPWQEQGGQSNRFDVPDYESLATSLFFAGTHKEVSVRQGQFELLLALGGAQVTADESDYVGMARRVLDYYTELMGGIPRLSADEELFRAAVVINDAEITDGEAIGNNISIMLEPGGDPMSGTIARMIFVHEFFHLWNGKSFAPQDDDAEWFKEGFSNYYTLKALHKIGFLEYESYLALLANFFYQRYDGDDGVGRFSMTNGEMKHDHWGLIYSGGLFVAIEQDFKIRTATNNEKSLDDLMRHMYTEFGENNYSLADLERALSGLSGESQQTYFDRYITGIERLPVAQILGLAGIEVRTENGQTQFVMTEDPTGTQAALRRGLFGHR